MMTRRSERDGVGARVAAVVFAAALAIGAFPACSERARPAEPAAKEPAARHPAGRGDLQAGAEEKAGREGLGALEKLVAEELKVDPDHRRTREEERAVLADLYVTFTLEPGKFVEKVEALESGRRRQIAGYLLCAAPELAAASRGHKAGGAPREIGIPEAASDLVAFSGSAERGKTQFFRQLSGEFLVIGRLIRSIDSGERDLAGHVIERQLSSLQMLEMTQPPEKRLVWQKKVTKAFPALFASLLPDC